MTYVEGTLSQDEEVLEKIKLHWVNYLRSFVIGLAMLVLVFFYVVAPIKEWIYIFLFFLVCLLYDLLKLYTIEMVITNKRVIYRKGIISIKTEELKTNKVEAIEIKQSIIGRILGFGDICFAGMGSSVVEFVCVDKPWAVKSMAETIIDEYQDF